jgi:hypothetical protein
METVNHTRRLSKYVMPAICYRLIDDLESSVAEGVCNEILSVPRTAAQIGSEPHDPQLGATFGEAEDQLRNVRRVWSREEFLHETAGMGGPDISMRPRSVSV